jgi:hypothetical protein
MIISLNVSQMSQDGHVTSTVKARMCNIYMMMIVRSSYAHPSNLPSTCPAGSSLQGKAAPQNPPAPSAIVFATSL